MQLAIRGEKISMIYHFEIALINIGKSDKNRIKLEVKNPKKLNCFLFCFSLQFLSFLHFLFCLLSSFSLMILFFCNDLYQFIV